MVEHEADYADSKLEAPVTSTPTQRAPATNDATERMLSTIDVAEAGLAALEREHTAGQREPAAAGKRTKLTLSVVIPVFNEVETIRAVVQRVLETELAHEVVVVDDASTDGTRDVLLALADLDGVRVLMHGYNKGKGAALRTAFEYARGDIVLIQDADLEYSPADYPTLLAPIEAGEADVVYGSRFLENPRQDPSWLHRLGNAALTWLSNRTTGLQLTDMETCYKVFRRAALRDMVLREKRFGFEPELTAKLARRRCRFHEVPIAYDSRGYAEGKKIHVGDGFRAVYCILRYAWLD